MSSNKLNNVIIQFIVICRIESVFERKERKEER